MELKFIEGIGSHNIERLVQFRVKPGADLRNAIEEAVRAEGIRAGVIVSGLGALKKAVFRNLKVFPKRYPVTPEDRLYREVTAPMELVSLGGWVAAGFKKRSANTGQRRWYTYRRRSSARPAAAGRSTLPQR